MMNHGMSRVVSRQTGIALPVVLVLLAMGVMLGVAGLRTALTAERLAGNLNISTQAAMSAEAAASQGWSALTGPGDMTAQPSDLVLDELTWQSFNDPATFQGQAAMSGRCSAPWRCVYRYIETPAQRRIVVAMGAMVEGGSVQATSQPVLASVAFSRLAELLSRYALMAGGEVVNADGERPEGRVHSNVAQSPADRVGIPAVDTTPPGDAELLALQTDAEDQPYCRFDLRGDLAGRTYHCAGRLEVAASARFHHATLMAQGDARVKGEVGQGAPLDVAIVAGGDIYLESLTQTRAWLFSAGDTHLKAGSLLEGAALAHGNILANGSQHHQIGHPRLPNVPLETRLVSWE